MLFHYLTKSTRGCSVFIKVYIGSETDSSACVTRTFVSGVSVYFLCRQIVDIFRHPARSACSVFIDIFMASRTGKKTL